MKWNEFEKEIETHINKYNSDPEYFNWLSKPVWNKFYEINPLTNDDVDEILLFLKKWGQMSRVIGQIKKKYVNSMHSNFIEIATKVKPFLILLKSLEFREFNSNQILREVNGNNIKNSIERTFDEIEGLMKDTMPSKILHMINPNYFIMWDKTIRTKWGCEANGNGYINFMIRMKLELDELIEDYSHLKGIPLKNGYNELLVNLNSRINQHYSITKWIDVYNWTKYVYRNRKVKEEIILL